MGRATSRPPVRAMPEEMSPRATARIGRMVQNATKIRAGPSSRADRARSQSA